MATDDLVFRRGEKRKIRHVVRAYGTPANVVGTVRNTAGDAVASGAGAAAAGDESGIYTLSYLWNTAAADLGAHTYALQYEDDGETVCLRGGVEVLPAASVFDRWVQRVGDWMLETSKGEERELSFRQFRDSVWAAVQEYSKACRYRQAAAVALSAGTWEYALPAGWEAGASSILAVECPVDDTQQVRDWLKPDDWQVDELRGKWRFTADSPQGGEVARLYWQGPHVVRDANAVVDEADTVPDGDFHTVSQYAAGLCLLQLANRAPRVSAPEVGATIVNARTKEQEYGARAKVMMAEAKSAWDDSAGQGAGGSLPPDAGAATATWSYLAGHEM